MEYTIHPIAHIRTDFTDKFGIPRQSGLVPELTARIVFEPEYRDPNALVGIEGYDRLWLIWQFSIPLVFGNLFQQMYNMVDTIIVGKYLGLSALTPSGGHCVYYISDYRILYGNMQRHGSSCGSVFRSGGLYRHA